MTAASIDTCTFVGSRRPLGALKNLLCAALITVALVLVLATFATASVAQARQLSTTDFPAPWVGGAYSDDATGEFANCVAQRQYNGVTFGLAVYRDGNTWRIGLMHPAWRFTDAYLDFSYRFDGGPWFDARASIIGPSAMVLEMPKGDAIIEMFKSSRWMEFGFTNGAQRYPLAGTSKLFDILRRCVVERVVAGLATNDVDAQTDSAEPDRTARSSGSGIIVGSDAVLTNFHVVNGCASFFVTRAGDVAKSAALLRTDPQNDLAILKVDALYQDEDIASFRQGRPTQAGEMVAVYGFPLTGMLSTSGNIVSGNVTSLAGLGDDARWYQISAPVQPGNSGGPLIDSSGLIIGVINARIDDAAVMGATGSVPQNVNFAIKGNVATNFLDASAVNYRYGAPSEELTLVDIANKARRFTVLIECL